MSFNWIGSRSKPGPVGPTPSFVSNPIRNINAHLFFDTPSILAAKIAAAQLANVQTLRIDVPWNQMQSSGHGTMQATYVTKMAAAIQACQAASIGLTVTIAYSPSWASSGPGGEQNAPPTLLSNYTDFLTLFLNQPVTLVNGFVTTFGACLEQVQVWNEPDQGYSWDKNLDTVANRAATYVALLKASYPIIKSAYPHIKVLGPVVGASASNSPAPNGLANDWFENYWAASPQGFYDVIDVHCYVDPPNHNAGLSLDGAQAAEYFIGYMMTTINAYDPTTEIQITEVGWDTSNGTGGPSTVGVTTTQQASYLSQMYYAILSAEPRVSRIYWYVLTDDTTGVDPPTGGYGLFTSTSLNLPPFTPKPSMAVFAGLSWASVPAQPKVADTSGNGYHGIPVGTTVTSVAGQAGFGNAIQINGGKVILPNIPLTGPFTWETWWQNASATAPAANQSIVSRRTNLEAMFLIDRTATSPANSFGAAIRDAAGTPVTHFLAGAAGDANTTAWTHLALSWDGTNAYFFIGGVLKQTVAVGSLAPMDPELVPCFGSDLNNGGTGALGTMQSTRLSSVARYTATFTPPTGPFTTDGSTIGLWPCTALT